MTSVADRKQLSGVSIGCEQLIPHDVPSPSLERSLGPRTSPDHRLFKPRSILLELRQQTAVQHRELETKSNIWDDLGNPGRYRSLLSRMFGIYAPLEFQLQTIDGLQTVLPDISERWKTPLLAADLAVLHFSREPIPACTDIPLGQTVAAALGRLYVLEGSTLGGQLICRRVQEQLGFTSETGCRFFSSYGTNVGRMWGAFCGALERFSDSNQGERYNIIQSAIDTFDCFTSWLGRKENEVS